MFPFFPSLPNHAQTPGCNGLAPQQMMLPNLQQQVYNPCFQSNPSGFSKTQQIPPQLHAQGYQFQNPGMAAFNNQNMDNIQGRSVVMPNHPQLTPSPSVACRPNVPLAVQTPLMGMQPQHPEHRPQTLNKISAMPLQSQICSIPHTLNQIGVPQLNGQFGINSQMANVNQVGPYPQGEQFWPQTLLQNLNQVMGLLGQFHSHNLMLPLNQLQQLLQHTVGTTQTGPFNVPHSSCPVLSSPGFQNTSSSNSHLGPRGTDSGFDNALVSTDPAKNKAQDQGMFTEMASVSQNAAQKSLDAMQNPLPSFPSISRRTNNMQKILPSHSVQLSQASQTKNGKNDISAAISVNYACRNFKRYPHGTDKRDQSFRRFQKPNHHARHWGKGPLNGRERGPQLANYEKKDPEKHRRGRGSLKYTEEEIKQWCEARRRNFPTAANIEKKKHESNGNREALNEDAKICRQQLKEVLARQMELGLEVAEVPSHYLSDPEDKACVRNEREKSHIAGRYPNKYGKRGRHGLDKCQSKRRKSRDDLPSSAPIKRMPTLLQKLLSSEIKRDRSRLLQVFRFMTMNSFFEHWPDKPLEYPQVIARDLVCEVDCASAEGKSLRVEHSTTASVSKNLRNEEADGQAESGAADKAEESADKGICECGSYSLDGDGEIAGWKGNFLEINN